MTGNLPSTKPYLIRAIHEWCGDNGFTPHVAVRVDDRARVPREYARNGQIILNIGHEATGALQIGNDLISFKARFGGVAHDLSFPVDSVMAIYARENGMGMAFEPEGAAMTHGGSESSGKGHDPDPRTPPPAGRPKLHRIK
ncbi:MAG: ClpXP protease specificity-enhancing factor [Candidatus Accumulibacter sp.]|jgi:stringent starvation protein B|nr:ClpXP protease specificity-enhancing factor [Accumulibacter sp.]